MKKYIQEITHLKPYIISIALVIGSSYSVYFIFSPEIVASLGEEDHFFEWWTVISLLLACAVNIFLFIKTKNKWHLLLSLLFFFGAGEEISWGQRIVGFNTPELMRKINVQDEFSVHNIEIFNTRDFHGYLKNGISRLLEMNYLFRLFMICYGIFVPFLVYHFNLIQKLTEWAKLPIPPISVGILFFINWFVYWVLHAHVISSQYGPQYLDTAGEIFECMGAFILLVISIYFHIDRKIIIIGKDIKNYLQ